MSVMKIFAGQSNFAIAQRMATSVGAALGLTQVIRFSNENIKVKVCENVRGCDVFVVQTSCPPVSENLMELLITLDALKYASAGRVTAVLPYYPYALADSKDEPRISVASRLMADLISQAGADRILTMSLHSPQTVGFSRIPVDQLSGVSLICDYFAGRDLSKTVAAAPDISRAKVAEIYAKRLGLPLVVIDKRTDFDGEVRVHGVIGDVEGKDVIFFDDEIVTGNSVLDGVEAVRRRGAERIYAGCVHGTLAGQAVTRLGDSDLELLAVTDTIPLSSEKVIEKIKLCSIAELFGRAMKAIHEETSISALFD